MRESLKNNQIYFFVGLAFLLIGILYQETEVAIFELWISEDNPTYSHGPLLLVISVLIILRELYNRSSKMSIQPSYFFLSLLWLSSFIWFLAIIGFVQIVHMLLLVVIAGLVIITILGWRQSIPFMFPILLIIGALPVWDIFGPYLQRLTAVSAGWLTSSTIHPSVRDGMNILIPAGTFKVDSGCSGLAYFIVSILIALLFSYSYRLNLRRTLMHVCVAMVIAVAANIVRVYVIVLSGQLTNMKSYLITVEHVSLGWGIFLVGITIYLWFASKHVSDTESGDLVQSRFGTAHNQPVRQSKYWTFSLLLIIGVIVGPFINTFYKVKSSDNIHISEITSPEVIGNWAKVENAHTYRPQLVLGNAYLEAAYKNKLDGGNVDVYLNHFAYQRQGAEAVSDLNMLSDKIHTWNETSNNIIKPGIEGFNNLREATLVARNGEEKLLWSWYETNGIRTSQGWEAKYQNIIGILVGEPSIRMIVLATKIMANENAARIRLRDFAHSSLSKFNVTSQVIEDVKG